MNMFTKSDQDLLWGHSYWCFIMYPGLFLIGVTQRHGLDLPVNFYLYIYLLIYIHTYECIHLKKHSICQVRFFCRRNMLVTFKYLHIAQSTADPLTDTSIFVLGTCKLWHCAHLVCDCFYCLVTDHIKNLSLNTFFSRSALVFQVNYTLWCCQILTSPQFYVLF